MVSEADARASPGLPLTVIPATASAPASIAALMCAAQSGAGSQSSSVKSTTSASADRAPRLRAAAGPVECSERSRRARPDAASTCSTAPASAEPSSTTITSRSRTPCCWTSAWRQRARACGRSRVGTIAAIRVTRQVFLAPVSLTRIPALRGDVDTDRARPVGIAVLGAGPAGLTASYVLAKRGVAATVFDADGLVGGIAKTVEFNGYRFDLGGHRFFTKLKPIERLWESMLGDDFLTRPRLSRIYYQGEYYYYPLEARNVVGQLGLAESVRLCASYLAAGAWWR